jgi:hypothetical protein
MLSTKTILEFLNQHSGQEFCTACLSRRLFNGRGIDVAMRQVEGWGIVRRHGHCAGCGHARLVAGAMAN